MNLTMSPAALRATAVSPLLAGPIFPVFPPLPTADELATGLAGAIGCKYLPTTNQLVFVEYNSGKIGLLNLIAPMIAVVSSGTVMLPGGSKFDCETGAVSTVPTPAAADLWWEIASATERRMAPIGGARISNLGIHDYAAVSSAALQTLPYDTQAIEGDPAGPNNLPSGTVFGVHTNAGNYCKVRVNSYGHDLNVSWTTYKVGPRLQYIGTGYDFLEDIIVDPDGVHAFVTERDGDILHVDLTHGAYAVANEWLHGLNTPQQAQFSAAGDAIYVVEYASPGRLVKINRATKALTVITSGLENAVGLVLSEGDAYAYVSEQPASGGRVRRVALPSGAITPVAGGFTAPFMMAWTDPSKQHLVLCERDPANRLAVVDVLDGTVTRPVTGLDFRPSAVAMIGGGRALVTTDQTIDEVQLLGTHVLAGPDFKGIGFVPIDHIGGTGLANTPDAPNPAYRFTDAPFGGLLPIKINHLAAFIDNARWYELLVDGVEVTAAFGDYKWNAVTSRYEPANTPVSILASGKRVYPVRTIADLMLWYEADLGGYVDSTSYADGMHTIEVVFYDAAGANPFTSGLHAIAFDNSKCSASLDSPLLNGATPASDECGVLYYTSKPTDHVRLTFTASKPHGSSFFGYSVIRGITGVTPPLPVPTDPAPNAPVSINPALADLLGKCTIAGFVENLSVYTKAINGVSRQSQYDASAERAFCLAPS